MVKFVNSPSLSSVFYPFYSLRIVETVDSKTTNNEGRQ